MNDVSVLPQILWGSLNQLLVTVAEYLPAILGALILLLGGLIVSALVKGLIINLVKWTKLSSLMDSLEVKKSLEKIGITTDPNEVIGTLAYWTTYLVFVSAAFQALEISIVSDTVTQLVLYLPNIVIASITALLTLLIARWVKKLIEASTKDLPVNTGIVAFIAEVSIGLFGSVIVLSQLGLDMTIVTANVTVIVASFAVASGFLFAFGGRTLVANLMGGMVMKTYLKEGNKVVVLGKSGVVKVAYRTGVVIKTSEGEEFIPYALIQQQGSLEQK